MNTIEVNCHVKAVLINILAAICCLFLINLNVKTSSILQVVLICCGVYNIVYTYKRTHIFLSPVTILGLIWLILIPLTAGSAPLMEAMTLFQWNYYLAGALCIYTGMLISLAIYQRKCKILFNIQGTYSWKMTYFLYKCCISVLAVGVVLYIVQAKISGGFPIFSADPDASRRNFFVIPGAALASNLGFLSIYLIFNDSKYRKRKLFWVLTAVYLSIQILMTVRFLLFLIIIAMISTLSNTAISKQQMRRIIFGCLVAVLGFIIVSLFRGGIEDKQKFFIKTGVYSGTARELVNTEIVRYIGMSQRTMESYMKHYDAGCAMLGHTLFPLFDTVGIKTYIPTHYGVYGYTACNIITYFYFDAGHLWWLLMIVWSFILNNWYYSFRQQPYNIVNKYLWGISAIGMTMSFYCYINAYPYWYFHYIVILYILKAFNTNGLFYYIEDIKR